MTLRLLPLLLCGWLACGTPAPPLAPGEGTLVGIHLPVVGATFESADAETTTYALPDESPDAAAERWISALSHPGATSWEVSGNTQLLNGVRVVTFDRGPITLTVLFAKDKGRVIALVSKR